MPPRFKYTTEEPPAGDFWLQGEGAELISWCTKSLESGKHPADLILPLKARFGSLGVAALELANGRKKASEIPNLPALALVHRESLEQSSKPPLNTFHANLFAGFDTVLEVGAGLGLDTIALAKVAKRVITLEPNLERAQYIKTNLSKLGINNVQIETIKFEQANEFISKADGVYADPSRRVGGERVRDPDECLPSLKDLVQACRHKALAVKLSPTASNYPISENYLRLFIGGVDDAREILLCSASLFESKTERLIILEQSGKIHELELQGNRPPEQLAIEKAKFIFEPHPLTLTAPGGVRTICEKFRLALLTTEHGYMIRDSFIDTGSWANCYEIVETIPFRYEKIQDLVNRYSLTNQTAIKKREHSADPNALHRKIKWATKPNAESPSALICIDSGTNQWCSLVTPRTSGIK